MSSWFVVKAERCVWPEDPLCLDPHLPSSRHLCDGCNGNGSALDVSSAIPVEPADLYDGDTINAWPNGRGVKAFVPVESSSPGEGGDQWPEATGDTVRENTEVAPSESVRLVAEAPEGTQPPGLSDGDER